MDLKNSKELLEHLKSPTFNHVTSIKSFDFATLYTAIPHQKLKYRLATFIRNAFMFKYKKRDIKRDSNRRYKYLVLVHEETYFVKEHFESKNKYSEDDIIKMLEFLVDKMYVNLPEKSSSRRFAFEWVRIVPLFSPTSFCIHTKWISYSLCSQRERNI